MLKSAKPELFEEGLAREKLLPHVPHKWVSDRSLINCEQEAGLVSKLLQQKADVNPTDPKETECFVWVIS